MPTGKGTLNFEELCELGAKFMGEEEEDLEKVRDELREAFRLYDKEGMFLYVNYVKLFFHFSKTFFFHYFVNISISILFIRVFQRETKLSL